RPSAGNGMPEERFAAVTMRFTSKSASNGGCSSQAAGRPMKDNKFMKRSLTIAALGIGAMMCAPAVVQAGSIKNGSAVDLTVGGQVNRALLYVDDGTDNDYRHIDSENNSTRFFFD